jgi:hypothetical protein
MKKLTLFLLLVLMINTAFCQIDFEDNFESVALPGFYLSFHDFRSNSPITPESIITDRNPWEPDFYLQLYREGKIVYTRDGKEHAVSHTSIWGYCDGKRIYIAKEALPRNFFSNEDIGDLAFVRIDFFGTLSLIHYVRNLAGGGQNHLLYAPNQPMVGVNTGRSKEIELIFDTGSGKFYKATLANLEKLIADDEELLTEFNKKNKKEQDIKLYIFLRKYNERHPFEFW